MWGLRDVMLLQIYYQQISKEQQKLYQEKINKEMKANELRIRALEQGIDDGEDI